MILSGIPVIVSHHLPKMEKADLSFARSFLQRMADGKLHDLEITEEDAIFLIQFPISDLYGFKKKRYESRLIVSPETYKKIQAEIFRKEAN